MYFSSRRDSPIVAWHEVPGKRPPKELSRRTTSILAWHECPMMFEVMDRFLNTLIFSVLTSETSSPQYFNHRIEVRTPARIRLYPTGRFLEVAVSRHFVPGYDRTVPPGKKIHSPRRGFDQVSAYGVLTMDTKGLA